MALYALDLETITPYVSDLDPDKGKPEGEGNPTKFMLRTLDSFIMGRVNDMLLSFDADGLDSAVAERIQKGEDAEISMNTKVNQAEAAFEACMFGIADIENWVDPKTKKPAKWETKEVSFSGNRRYQKATRGMVERLDARVVMEVYRELQARNSVPEDEEKNSDGSSPASNSSQSETARGADLNKKPSGDATPEKSKQKTAA